MTTILVTGGAGFIGANLSRTLLEKGNAVIAVDNFITSSDKNLRLLKKYPEFTFIKHDITKPLPKKLTDRKIDMVYHLACPTGVPNLIPLAEEMLLTCSVGTKNILEYSLKNSASFLFTSSSEVYGDPEVFPQPETYTGNVDPDGIRSPYEEGKRFSESLVVMYVRKYKLDAKIVRIFNTYGPLMSKNDSRVIPNFLGKAVLGKPLPVQGDGKQKRTFCYVDDLVNGLQIVMRNGKKGETYNLGSDKEITVLNLAKKVKKMTKTKSEVAHVDRPSHDHKRRLPNLEKVTRLGWQQKVSLDEGLARTIEWYTS